jgi:hypothetical protein
VRLWQKDKMLEVVETSMVLSEIKLVDGGLEAGMQWLW